MITVAKKLGVMLKKSNVMMIIPVDWPMTAMITMFALKIVVMNKMAALIPLLLTMIKTHVLMTLAMKFMVFLILGLSVMMMIIVLLIPVNLKPDVKLHLLIAMTEMLVPLIAVILTLDVNMKMLILMIIMNAHMIIVALLEVLSTKMSLHLHMMLVL
jgi:hypothetical protein